MNIPKINKDVVFKLENYLNFLKFKWDSLYPKTPGFRFNKSRIVDCTVFLISVLDNLIVFVQENIPRGSDKKATVIAVVSDVFDHIMLNSSPIWLKPFVPLIKEVVVSIVISQLIEFIVGKYKESAWVDAKHFSNSPDQPQTSIIYNSRKDF
jgi:hypothetical protein